MSRIMKEMEAREKEETMRRRNRKSWMSWEIKMQQAPPPEELF